VAGERTCAARMAAQIHVYCFHALMELLALQENGAVPPARLPSSEISVDTPNTAVLLDRVFESICRPIKVLTLIPLSEACQKAVPDE
jgi:hypothetical protein